MEYKDYYRILGVEKKSTQDEIKKAYRKLAIKLHPDKNPGDKKSEELFKEINEAYDVLGEVDKRKKYDALGENWQAGYQQGNTNNYNRSSNTEKQQGNRKGSSNQEYYSSDESRFSDFFEHIFGGAGGGGFTNHRQAGQVQLKGEDYKAEATVTLEEAFYGAVRQITLEDQTLNLKLKPGITDGQTLKMKEKGGPGINGGPNGDLYIVIHVSKHTKYERKGNDLLFDQPLNVYTAILGGKLSVSVIDKTIFISIPPGTDSGKTFRLKGMGMPLYNDPVNRGDCYVHVNITVPKTLTEQEKAAIQPMEFLKN